VAAHVEGFKKNEIETAHEYAQVFSICVHIGKIWTTDPLSPLLVCLKMCPAGKVYISLENILNPLGEICERSIVRGRRLSGWAGHSPEEPPAKKSFMFPDDDELIYTPNVIKAN